MVVIVGGAVETLFAGDESGNLSFDFAKGGTSYFVLALVAFEQPDEIRERMDKFRRERGLSSREFSFHEITSARLKDNLFRLLATVPFSAWTVVARKRELGQSYALMARNTLYAVFLSEAIAQIPYPLRDKRGLVLDEYDRSGKVFIELGRVMKARRIKRGFRKIAAKRSSSDTLIQIADLIAGAVYCKYAKGDDHYFRMIQDKVVVAEFSEQEKPPS